MYAATLLRLKWILEAQIRPLVDEIQALNQATQAQLEKRLQQKSTAERAATCLSQWEPLAVSDLDVTILLPETNSPSLSTWKAICTQKAKSSIRLEKNSTGVWQFAIHNGNYLIVNTSESTAEQKDIDGWDLKPLHRVLDDKPTPTAIRQACQQIYRAQLLAVQKAQRELAGSEAALKQLAQKRQDVLLRQQTRKITIWYELPEFHPQ